MNELTLMESIGMVKSIDIISKAVGRQFDDVASTMFFLFNKEEKAVIQNALDSYKTFSEASIEDRAKMMGFTVQRVEEQS